MRGCKPNYNIIIIKILANRTKGVMLTDRLQGEFRALVWRAYDEVKPIKSESINRAAQSSRSHSYTGGVSWSALQHEGAKMQKNLTDSDGCCWVIFTKFGPISWRESKSVEPRGSVTKAQRYQHRGTADWNWLQRASLDHEEYCAWLLHMFLCFLSAFTNQPF